jgi:receptor expression-enhancing protein 5/6
LTYWVVFGAFNVVEFFSDWILHWVPFYYIFKAVSPRRVINGIKGITLYLILPQTRGAQVLYQKVLRPYLVKKEDAVDAAINKIKTAASNAVEELKKE